MGNSNLDVWAIQYIPDELEIALSNLKLNGNTILYTNALCTFRIGSLDILSKQFDTFFYSEENDLFVMLMRGGEATADDVRRYLESHNIDYNEVVLAPSIVQYADDDKIPELWTTREESSLEDALKDSVERGSKPECDYYPNLVSSIDLSYLTSSNNKSTIDGRVFKGLIQMESKIILLVGQNDERNVKPVRVYELLEKYGFKCNVLDGEPNIIEESRKKTK